VRLAHHLHGAIRDLLFKEAADYLGVTVRTIRQMITDGKIRGYRANGRQVEDDEVQGTVQLPRWGTSRVRRNDDETGPEPR
jgi:excisionase family DNA binding protein